MSDIQNGAKQAVSAWVDGHRREASEWHSTIWELAEPAWREYRSAAWYVDKLRAEGFSVEAGSGGMPTAFSATWTNGEGPVVLAYAEYDAVPGNCQAATTSPQPREGLSRFAPGHTDPHSALGISTLAGVLAAKDAMTRRGVTGTIRYMGEPAEKVQGSKVVHGLRGYYDDVDAIISFHPFYMLPLCNTVRWDTHCGAYYSKIYTFLYDPLGEGDGRTGPATPIPAAHGSISSTGAGGALAGMQLLARGAQSSMAPFHGSWTLSEAVLTAGQATADNLPAGLAQIQYAWRCPTVEMADRVLAVLDRTAHAAADAAGCTIKDRWVARNRPGIANHVLAETLWRNLQQIGAPAFNADAVSAANQIRENLGLPPTPQPFLEECLSLVDPREAERLLRLTLPAWQWNFTSDDYVEMTLYAPTVRFYIARPALREEPDRPGYPAWVMNALGGIAATIDPMIVTAAKTVGQTIVELLTSPDVLAAARREFEQRAAEATHPKPLLPADFDAPVSFRWPEYVETARGREWWIPDSDEYCELRGVQDDRTRPRTTRASPRPGPTPKARTDRRERTHPVPRGTDPSL